MSNFIDRRTSSKNKSAVNRQRFIKRFKKHIRQSVNDAISGRKITEIESSEQISIPPSDIDEPIFTHGPGGKREIVMPGNKDFVPGDRIRRPPASGGSGSTQGSNSHETSSDDFVFTLSKQEFLEIFFEDMELPSLIKNQLRNIPNYKFVRAGFSSSGTPGNINIIRSLRNSLARRAALGGQIKQKIKKLEHELEHATDSDQQKLLTAAIAKYKQRLEHIPFIDPFDIRYNRREKQLKPSTQAVMFCIMDVSGSMDEQKKELAKRFFILLYLFLTRTYQTIELVFIRHHTLATEVDEQEFFYSRETGGTVVSSALELMVKIINERYLGNEWNIYGAQASDGDNWNNDSPHCHDLLQDQILPLVQYFAYIEIMPRQVQSLWKSYEDLKVVNDNFAMQQIQSQAEIFPVLRKLFKRQASSKK